MNPTRTCTLFATALLLAVSGVSCGGAPARPAPGPTVAPSAAATVPAATREASVPASTATSTGTTASTATPVAPAPPPVAAPVASIPIADPGDPLPFEDAVRRAGSALIDAAVKRLGGESRRVVIDPLIDANTGGQTVSSVRMGRQLEDLVARNSSGWRVAPLTRQSLQERPLLLIGTLTPVTSRRAADAAPDAFRIWLTLIDLRTQRIVAKELRLSTLASVDPTPLPYYRDSPSWHKDAMVQGYIDSCQTDTKVGDLARIDYLIRLEAAALVNEATTAYDQGRMQDAQRLYLEAKPLAVSGDLRVLNGLYLTSWRLGRRDAARQAFSELVASSIEAKRVQLKFLYQPAQTDFIRSGDLPDQYQLWLNSLAGEIGRTRHCVNVIGHTSRTGSARANETLSRQRAETMRRLLERQNGALSTRLNALGAGSREALIGLGTDDERDALDRRVEFRVVDCV